MVFSHIPSGKQYLFSNKWLRVSCDLHPSGPGKEIFMVPVKIAARATKPN
jgi:hypothetical protein